MGDTVPAPNPRKTTEEPFGGGRTVPFVKEQSLIDEMREAMKDARERAEERRDASHENVLVAGEPEPEPARELEPEPEPARIGPLRRFLRRS
jgi:hypothetical protein